MNKILVAALSVASAFSLSAPAFAFCGIDGGVGYGDTPVVSWTGDSSVYWYVDTRFAKVLSVRRNNSNDRFVLGRENPSDVTGSDCLNSGSYLRLSTPVYADYLIADTEINSSVVLASRDYGPPKYKGTGTFFIEKTGGSPGSVIRYGDAFRIRGTSGNAWLCANCNGKPVSLTQNVSLAATWRFVR